MLKLTGDRRVIVITCPVDMRKGAKKLPAYLEANFNIKLATCQDVVVMVSRSAKMLKLVGQDRTRGLIIYNQYLSKGTFERFLSRTTGHAQTMLTKEELEKFLNAEHIFMHRNNPSYH